MYIHRLLHILLTYMPFRGGDLGSLRTVNSGGPSRLQS